MASSSCSSSEPRRRSSKKAGLCGGDPPPDPPSNALGVEGPVAGYRWTGHRPSPGLSDLNPFSSRLIQQKNVHAIELKAWRAHPRALARARAQGLSYRGSDEDRGETPCGVCKGRQGKKKMYVRALFGQDWTFVHVR
jgi:hypothetical protein